jgi:ketosteroid isomerase-like protein
MNKLVVLVVALSIHQLAVAQRSIEGLVQAEKNFAAWSVTNGVRSAFLKFADSAGIIFDNGKPVNAIEAWTKREEVPIKLDWWPEYAEISGSGDFGYTTGGWNLSVRDTVRNSGYYNSVWHMNQQGEWKFLIDLGVSNTMCDFSALKKIVNNLDLENIGTQISLRQAEESFINAWQQTGKTAYTNALSPQSRLYRNEHCADVVQPHWALDSLPAKIQYTISGSAISSSGDVGFVYGTTTISGKEDGYLRIWRREKEGWRIALEVLRF